jgi:hypothetical protein
MLPERFCSGTGTILAHDMQHAVAAGADLVLDVDDLPDAWQMGRQGAPIGAALSGVGP